MFFLGIAGPLMPYLLFIGTILVFTMGTSQEALAKIANKPIETNMTILTEQSTSTELSGKDTFYFQEDQKEQQHFNEATASLNSDFLTPHFRTKNKPNGFVGLLYSNEYNSSYFGLSPPCCVTC